MSRQIRVEFVYEPPQENYPEGFEVSEDPKADTVEALAGLLGLKRVSERDKTQRDTEREGRGVGCLMRRSRVRVSIPVKTKLLAVGSEIRR